MRTASLLVVALSLAACGAAPPDSGRPGSPGPLPAGGSPTAGPAASPDDAGDPLTGAAFGPWRPAPYPFSGHPEVVEPLDDACRVAEPAIGAARPLALADLRGAGRLILVLADETVAFACLGPVSAPDPADVEVRPLDLPATAIGDENLDLLLYETFEDAEGAVGTVAVGRVGRIGTRVSASFDDESYVDATKASGWWAMWWPTDVDAATFAVLDRQSVALDALPAPR